MYRTKNVGNNLNNHKAKEGMKSLKNHRKKEKKNHILGKLLGQILVLFFVATISIVLYDMYINIDVYEDVYTAERVSKEVSTKNTEDISQMLEEVSKSVVGISKIETSDTSIFSINAEKKLSLGSGIIVSDNGYILTNEHVSGGKYSKCYITLENRRRIRWNSNMGRF